MGDTLTLRSFLEPTKKRMTLDGSFSFRASASHCLRGPLSPAGGQALPSRSHTAASPAAPHPPARLLPPNPPYHPHAQPQSHLVPLPTCHLPRVLQGRHVVDIEDDDDGWSGVKGGVRCGRGQPVGVGRGGDLTLRSPVVGGGDALEALLPGRVPPGGVGGEGGAVGCAGRGLAPTHSCRLKGTPSTSNRSISKSTPMVAL